MAIKRIASKLRLLAIAAILLTALSITWVSYWGHSAIIRDLQTETLKKHARMEIDRLDLAFNELDHDIQFIRNLPMLETLVIVDDTESAAAINAKDELSQIFSEMLKAKPNYAQIRIISNDSDGHEMVRVDQNKGAIVRVAEAALQSKGERYYFSEALDTPSGEIYHSAIDLNREHTVIEMPKRPMLRVAMTIKDAVGQVYGIAIINLNFESYMRAVLSAGIERERYTYYLLNDAGYYLVHPDTSKTFGFDLGLEHVVEHDFKAMEGFWQSTDDARTFRLEAMQATSGDLVHFEKFPIFEGRRTLAFGLVAAYDDIGMASNTLLLRTVLAVLLLILIATLFAYWFSGRLTHPLESIQRATKQFSKHNSVDEDLPVDRDDEIGELAKTFQEMQSAIIAQQNELVQANQKLVEMNHDLEQFARISSHELREPIRRIVGLANLYQSEQESSPEEAEQLLEQLNKECERALRQIADFREFSQIGLDMSLVKEKTPLQGLVSYVLKQYAAELSERKVEVQVDPLPELLVYPSLVRVLYRNLVDNALTHSNTDEIKLRFTSETDASGRLVLGVLNTGSEISQQNLELVFELFTRLTDHEQGTGMGLVICKRIVDRHNGYIWIESSDNSGVHIKFYLN